MLLPEEAVRPRGVQRARSVDAAPTFLSARPNIFTTCYAQLCASTQFFVLPQVHIRRVTTSTLKELVMYLSILGIFVCDGPTLVGLLNESTGTDYDAQGRTPARPRGLLLGGRRARVTCGYRSSVSRRLSAMIWPPMMIDIMNSSSSPASRLEKGIGSVGV